MRFFLAVLLLTIAAPSLARDDGRYADSPLKPWFDHLASGKGLCCSMSDGETVSDPDWQSKDGHYQVKLEGNWIDVPDMPIRLTPTTTKS